MITLYKVDNGKVLKLFTTKERYEQTHKHSGWALVQPGSEMASKGFLGVKVEEGKGLGSGNIFNENSAKKTRKEKKVK